MYAMDVKPIPGLEHLPWGEVWFHQIDEETWRAASEAARALGKTGLEAWTREATPQVVEFLQARGYEEVRRYFISELDVASAPDPGVPAVPLVTFAERPDLAPQLYAIALESYPDQHGREETRIGSFDEWRSWGLDPHRGDAYFIAVEDDRVLGYGFLSIEGDTAHHGFTGVARTARGRGVAGAIKRAQIRWAKENGLRTLRTANEQRLTGMRLMNERHGYRPLPAEIILRGPLAPAYLD
jgi:GNAT superfamily N-acetyltransferase